MDEKPVITIIKNGKEKKFVLSKFDQLFGDVRLKDIFKIKKSFPEVVAVDRRYSLKNDVNFVHIKNFTFKENLLIQGISSRDELKGDTLILENCIFEAENLTVEFFSNVVILNPILVNNNTRMNMHFMFCDDVRIVLSKTLEKEFVIEGLRGVEKFNLDSSYCLASVMLTRPNEVYLKNINELSYLDIRNGNITIENSTLMGERVKFYSSDKSRSSTLNLINSIFKDYYYHFVRTRELNMIDSSIRLNGSIYFEDLRKICLRNSHIVAFEHNIFLDNVEEIIIDDIEEASILDNSSYFEVRGFIKIRDKIIKNESLDNNLIIDKSGIEREFLFESEKGKTLSKKK